MLVVSIIFVFGFGVMTQIEDWSAVDAFYWAVVTISTIGYGDICPKTRGGRMFTCLYVIVGCSFMARYVCVYKTIVSQESIYRNFVMTTISNNSFTASSLTWPSILSCNNLERGRSRYIRIISTDNHVFLFVLLVCIRYLYVNVVSCLLFFSFEDFL